jgi:hypothetical protein
LLLADFVEKVVPSRKAENFRALEWRFKIRFEGVGAIIEWLCTTLDFEYRANQA